jgi:hypothetical protein
MTIFDYLAIGLLLMMLLAAARWFAQRKFELFPGLMPSGAAPCQNFEQSGPCFCSSALS